MNLDDFREPGKINSRLAAWAPKENSLRWHRSFLLLASRNLTPNQVSIYRKFGNVSLGNPVESVCFREDTGVEIRLNIDYLITLNEVLFLRKTFKSSEFPRTILELGAGFGRTCHGLLNNFSRIQRYFIVDLPEMLELSSAYLRKVLSPENFEKVEFIDAFNFEAKIESMVFDLGIQIDAFQEMSSESIDEYLVSLFARAHFLFFSNPIGKYLPLHAGLELTGSRIEDSEMVMKLGKSLQILDIWNEREIQSLRRSHQEIYKPKDYEVLVSKPSSIFPHFEMTIYQKHATNGW